MAFLENASPDFLFSTHIDRNDGKCYSLFMEQYARSEKLSAEESTYSSPILPVLGVDLGGTQIRVAVLRGEHILSRKATLTGETRQPERVLERIYTCVQQALDAAQIPLPAIAGIGIACPGPLDNRTGTVYAPPNLPGWDCVPLREMVQQHYRQPVFVENDANAAALGEYMFGAGQGSQNMVYLTVSTGIGAGVISHGILMEGASGAAGELGHMTIDWKGERCSCGNVGCLEALASGTAIERKAQTLIARGQGAELLAFASTLSERASTPSAGLPDAMPETKPAMRVTASTVARAAEAGIAPAQEIIARAAEALGVGLVNTLHIFNPEVIILGGGVMQMGSLLIDPALSFVKEHTMFSHLAGSGARIVQAQLGSNSGLIGAGALLYYNQHLSSIEAERRP